MSIMTQVRSDLASDPDPSGRRRSRREARPLASPSRECGPKLWLPDWTEIDAGRSLRERSSCASEYPPSQKSGSFGVDQVLQALQAGAAGTNK